MNNIESVEMRSAIRQWEWFRFAYNAIIAIEGLLLTRDLVIYVGPEIYVLNALAFGLIANAFFCVGPLIEFYYLAYDIKIGKGRYAIFAFGLLISMMVVLMLSTGTVMAYAKK